MSEVEDDYSPDDDAGMCDCGKETWDMCDCGEFFMEWICGIGSAGLCSMAGTEECDFECPHMADLRAQRRHEAAKP